MSFKVPNISFTFSVQIKCILPLNYILKKINGHHVTSTLALKLNREICTLLTFKKMYALTGLMGKIELKVYVFPKSPNFSVNAY